MSSNPTLSRWELAGKLRELRVAAGVTVEDAAKELMCSAAKISRMETAGRGIQPRDVRDLTRLYKVSTADGDELMALATSAKNAGWWQDYRTLDEQTQTYIGLEDAATELRSFDPNRLLGVLQVPSYTESLIRNLRTAGELESEWIKDAVALRSKRRQRVTNGSLTIHTVMDEAVLRRPIGGEHVMVEQLDQLLQDSERPNVTLQIVPFTRGSYPGLEGSAQLLSFPRRSIADVIFVEGLLGNYLIDKPSEIERYLGIFDDIVARFALSPADSASLLTEARDAYGAGSPTQEPPGPEPDGKR